MEFFHNLRELFRSLSTIFQPIPPAKPASVVRKHNLA